MTGARRRRGICLAALLLDDLLGDPQRWHPVAGFGSAALALERRLWRDGRLNGLLHTTLLVGATWAAVAAMARGTGDRRQRLLFDLGVLWTTLGGRSLRGYALALAAAIDEGDLARARELAPALVGRETSRLDGAELCRAAIESVAENTTDALVAPLFWFAVAGAPGAAAYRAANTLDAMVGHRSPRYARFGWAAARLDDLATWSAARPATALAVALAPVVGGRPRQVAAALRAARSHPSPNAGLIEAAFAAALDVRLGGRNDYGGRPERRPALGGSRTPAPKDVRRAVRLSRTLATAAALGLTLAGR